MQKISDKSRDNLYDAIHEEVMQARINIEKLTIKDDFIKEQLDKIMYKLCCAAPQRAISCFLYNKEK